MSKDAEQHAIHRFEEAVDRHQLAEFVQEKDDPRFMTLFGMMVDPAYRRHSFPTLLRKAGISFMEIQQVYADGQRHLGLMSMMRYLPEVMTDVALDAKNSTQPCPRCDAMGIVPMNAPLGAKEGVAPATRACPLCKGSKEIERMGDKHARELLFETAKLTKQSGPLVAVQTNVNIGDSRIEAMLKKTRSIILPEPKQVPHGE